MSDCSDCNLVGANQSWISNDPLHEKAGGQDVAFDVQDVSPARLEQKFALGVLLGFGTKFLMPQNLQIDESIPQPGKCQTQQQSQPGKPLILNSLCHKKKSPAA